MAKALLGKRLVRLYRGRRLSGIITETEAYLGPADVASHARHGPVSRAAPMFGDPGHAYVYFTYGMHYCLNVVTEPAGSGTAVLLRAVEPIEGVALMRRRRGNVPEQELTNGPAKLCQALAIDRRLNKENLLGRRLWIEEAASVSPTKVGRTPRIGIRQGRAHLWRFYLKGNSFVSKHPPY